LYYNQSEIPQGAGYSLFLRFGDLSCQEENMGDDVTNIIIPPEPTIEEETYEAIGEELLARLDQQLARLEELNARIEQLETGIAELRSREFAAIEHEHSNFAPTEHTHEHEHEGYAPAEHEHQAGTPPKEPDRPPEKQHPYFRKLGDF
jgi:TolA-binding protein